jgi:sensor domain CHASE-containing protein
LIDEITVITWVLLLASLIIFYFFGKFTVRLIRQHQDISSLIYELEDPEKESK